MSIASINSLSTPNISPETEQKSHDLDRSIKENLTKSVKYQIINKLLISKDTQEKDSQTSKNNDAKADSLSLSETAQTLSKETTASLSQNIITQDKVISDSTATAVLSSETSRTRLSFSQQADEQQEIKKTDPLAFDLDGNGIETTGVKQGIEFDIDANGKTEQTSFISGNDAFLAYDKNGNGVIDNGSELFGDQNGASNGYEELKKYDDNKDGIIDKNDAIYSDLKLLSLDKNKQQQLSSLKDQNIQSINLNYVNQHQAIDYYDSIEQTGSFKRFDGTSGSTADVLLAHK